MLYFRSQEIKAEIFRAYAVTECIEISGRSSGELDEAYNSLFHLYRDYILQRTEEIYANNLDVVLEFSAMFEFLSTVGYEAIQPADEIGVPSRYNEDGAEYLPF